MKVLVFAKHPGGGIRTYFKYVYGDVQFSSYSFGFLLPETDNVRELLSPHQNMQVYENAGSSNFRLLAALVKTVFSEKPDVVHSHGFTAGAIAAVALKLLRVKHIITTHDVFMDGQFKGIKGRLKKLLLGRILSFATIINPVGNDAKDNFVHFYPRIYKKGKVHAIRNGIDVSQFLGDDARNLRKEKDIPSSVLLGGFFGRFMAQKGFGTIMDSVESWNLSAEGRPLHVCCFGWGGFIREEQAELKKRGLEGYFHFFPATDEMGKAIRGVDFVFMPSKWEACPLLAMEVMVAGIPLISSDCIGLKEVTDDTPALRYVLADTKEGLIEKIEEFVREEDHVRAEAEEFRSVAAERFDVKDTARSLRLLFDQAMSKA